MFVSFFSLLYNCYCGDYNMFIDTHCHLSKEYYDDIDLVVEENKKAGISKMIVSGCDKESILESMLFASKYSDVYLTIGYHPSEADVICEKDLLLLENQLNNEKVIGIGEIGLDYHYGKENMEKQKELFRYQLDLASRLSMPVVIHSRDATLDTINILKEYPNVKGIIHCFSGSLETANIYISMGYKLGIGGVLTFKNSKLYKVIEEIDLDNIILETDSPYLSPEPFRGKQNNPYNVYYVAKRIAEIKGISIEEVIDITTKNARELFDI